MHTVDLNDDELDYITLLITVECIRANAFVRVGTDDEGTPLDAEAIHENLQRIRTGAMILGKFPLHRETYRNRFVAAMARDRDDGPR